MLIVDVRDHCTGNTPTFGVMALARWFPCVVGMLVVLPSSAMAQCMQDSSEACQSPTMQRLATAAAALPSPVLLTMVNAPYLPFILSWLCNTRRMDVHKHVLIMTTDAVSRDRLASEGVAVVYIGDAPPSQGRQRDVRVSLQYGEVRYWYFMAWRTNAVACLLRNGVRALLFEADAVWLRSPMDELERQGEGVDMALYKDASDHWGGGFVLLQATPACVKFWEELARRLVAEINRLCVMRDTVKQMGVQNDQRLLRQLIVEQYAGATHRDLPMDKFPSGQWYRTHQGEHWRALSVWLPTFLACLAKAEHAHDLMRENDLLRRRQAPMAGRLTMGWLWSSRTTGL